MNGTPKASELESPLGLHAFGRALFLPGDSQWGGPCFDQGRPQLFRLQAKVGLRGLVYAREPGSLAGKSAAKPCS